eukprot:m.715530 g.715530  ORF g.715530 m.715530 type:complete len:344 (-) comp58788_c0_seq23:79-1110(-)
MAVFNLIRCGRTSTRSSRLQTRRLLCCNFVSSSYSSDTFVALDSCLTFSEQERRLRMRKRPTFRCSHTSTVAIGAVYCELFRLTSRISMWCPWVKSKVLRPSALWSSLSLVKGFQRPEATCLLPLWSRARHLPKLRHHHRSHPPAITRVLTAPIAASDQASRPAQGRQGISPTPHQTLPRTSQTPPWAHTLLRNTFWRCTFNRLVLMCSLMSRFLTSRWRLLVRTVLAGARWRASKSLSIRRGDHRRGCHLPMHLLHTCSQQVIQFHCRCPPPTLCRHSITSCHQRLCFRYQSGLRLLHRARLSAAHFRTSLYCLSLRQSCILPATTGRILRILGSSAGKTGP